MVWQSKFNWPRPILVTRGDWATTVLNTDVMVNSMQTKNNMVHPSGTVLKQSLYVFYRSMVSMQQFCARKSISMITVLSACWSAREAFIAMQFVKHSDTES